jgi:uncharacterized membrane protein SpoIIM required for sporulation
MGLLYRQTAADLATVRTDPSAQIYALKLNDLLARAHNIIYSGAPSRPGRIFSFFLLEYPRIFRRNLALVGLSTGLFAFSAVVGVLLTVRDPAFELSILGHHMIETIERREMWTHSILSIKPLASSSIMTNNLSVSFTTFAAGITAGIGTLYMIAFNGLLIGVIGAACAISGMSLGLWSFVAPHGVLELPAIFIAGAAGFRIAQGLLFPGVLPRSLALSQAGGEAIRLLIGVIPMLIIAGVIEGFLSPSGMAVSLKFAFAAALFILLLVYLFRARKAAKSDSSL